MAAKRKPNEIIKILGTVELGSVPSPDQMAVTLFVESTNETRDSSNCSICGTV
jgi:hypothetical protein